MLDEAGKSFTALIQVNTSFRYSQIVGPLREVFLNLREIESAPRMISILKNAAKEKRHGTILDAVGNKKIKRG